MTERTVEQERADVVAWLQQLILNAQHANGQNVADVVHAILARYQRNDHIGAAEKEQDK